MRATRLFIALLAALVACDHGSTEPLPLRRNVLFTLGYLGESEIWEMVEDGTRWRRLTDNDVMDATPRWSRTLRQIVFARARVQTGPPQSLRFDIHIMDADGSDVRRVAESPSSDSLPTFSRDASTIAFVSRDPASEATYPRVFIMGADGTNRHVVSPLGLIAMTAAEWAPNGSQLLFGARRYGETTPMELITMNVDGTEARTIPEPCTSTFRLGRWSRDGSRISIICDHAGETPLFTMTAAGTDFRRITPPKPDATFIGDFGGMWSEDGAYLLVMRSEVGTAIPLYKAQAITGAATRIAEIASATFYLADWWSPFGPD